VGRTLKCHQSLRFFSFEENWNGYIGVAYCLLQVDDSYDYAVLEIGASRIGQHKFLFELAMPSFILVTNCGKDHLNGYGSYEGVKDGIVEIFQYLSQVDGVVFVNSCDPILMELTKDLNRVTYNRSGYVECEVIEVFPLVKVRIDQSLEIQSQLFGSINADNINAAVTIGKYFGVSDDKIISAIQEYRPNNLRSEIISWNSNQIILDTYNSNPSSLKPMLEDFNAFEANNKAVIIGDMLDLGDYTEKEHIEIMNSMTSMDFKIIIFVGTEYIKHKDLIPNAYYINLPQECIHILQSLNDYTIFVKGSRSLRLEKIFDI
jgi:UDP-N-acetylmuramoyl-tripeptide--D-alanyl-D-alanine ligase